MSLFSEGGDKPKVKTEDKRIKKYTYEDINMREDKETGKLELYIQETLSRSKEKVRGWSTARYKKRDINVRNRRDKIYYTFLVSPSGHFYTREYYDYDQERRYGKIYSVLSVLQQILGVSRQQAYNMQFTKEELIELIEKINQEKEEAIYQFVDNLKYSDSYNGRKTLEGLHIAVGYRYVQNSEKFYLKCVEYPNIKITIRENGTLEITKDGKKENVARENYGFVSTGILEKVLPGRTTSILGGYTFDAVQKIVEEQKKNRNKDRNRDREEK